MITATPVLGRVRTIVVTVAEHGGLDEATVELLIDCERRGVRVLLWLEEAGDADSTLAGLATHLATDDAALHAEAVAQIGAERAVLARGVRQARRRAAAEVLPPADRGPAGTGRKALRRARRLGRRALSRAARAADALRGAGARR